MAYKRAILTTCVLIPCVFASRGASGKDESAIRDILLARFAKLHNLIVTYTVTERLSLPPGRRLEDAVLEHEGGVRVDDMGTRVRREEFALFGSLFLYSYVVQSWNRGFDHSAFDRIESTEQETYILTPGRAEFLGGYRVRNKQPRYRGQVSDGMNTPMEYIPVILALGVRERPRLFTENDIKQMQVERSPDGRIMLRHAGDTGLIYEWTIDPDRGCTAAHFRSTFQGKPSGEWFMDDFRQVGGLILPYKVRVTEWWSDGSNAGESILDVNEYKLDDPANTPERYRMKWPEGAWVKDVRTDGVFYARGGELVGSGGRILDEAPAASCGSQSSDCAGSSNGNDAPGTDAVDTSGSAVWIWVTSVVAALGLGAMVLHTWPTHGRENRSRRRS